LDALPFDQLLTIAQKLGQNDRYDRELDLLAHIAQRFPDQTEAIRIVRDRALFNSRHYTELLGEPASNDPAMMLLRARAAWRTGDGDEFLKGLKAVEQKSKPSDKESIEAKILRAKYYTTDEPKLDVAIANLKSVVDAGAIGNEGENLWNLGFTY